MPRAKSTAKKQTEVAVKTETLPAAAAMYEDDANSGFEETSKDDFAIPFLRNLQKLSPQCDKSEPEYVEGAEEGRFINTVSNTLFDAMEIIICHYQRTFIEWQPRTEGGGFVASYGVDEGEQLAKTADEKYVLPNGNKISDTRMFYVLVNEEGNWKPALISLSSTQIKRAKTLMANMRDIKVVGKSGKKITPPTFANVYKVNSTPESNDQGKWSGWKFTHAGFVEDADVYNMAKAFRDVIKAGDAVIDHNQNNDATTADAADDANDY